MCFSLFFIVSSEEADRKYEEREGMTKVPRWTPNGNVAVMWHSAIRAPVKPFFKSAHTHFVSMTEIICKFTLYADDVFVFLASSENVCVDTTGVEILNISGSCS